MTALKAKPLQNATIIMHSTATTEHENLKDSRRSLWTMAALVLVCVLCGILIGSYLTMKIQNEYHPDTNDIIPTGDPPVICRPDKLKFMNRSEWLAQPPKHELTPLVLPSTRVIIAHTATEKCTTQASCTLQVRRIQTFHVGSRGFDDIGYNFLVGGDGAVYIGRGWDKQGAHTLHYNEKSICIAFIGNFNEYEPTEEQLCAARKLIEEGVKLKKLPTTYVLYGHKQLTLSDSPGKLLFNIIKTWNHWTANIK